MIQEISVTQISELANATSISSDSLFIVSNPETTDFGSYNIKYEMLSAQLYNDITSKNVPGEEQADPPILVLSAKIEELTTAVLRLANCAKQVRTVDLVSIDRRLAALEEIHADDGTSESDESDDDTTSTT